MPQPQAATPTRHRQRPAPATSPAPTTRPIHGSILITTQHVSDLADGASISVPLGPHEQKIILDGKDFDRDAIEALRDGHEVTIRGYTFMLDHPPADRPPRRSLVMVLADGATYSKLAGCQIVEVDSAMLASDPRHALATSRVKQQWGVGACLIASGEQEKA